VTGNERPLSYWIKTKWETLQQRLLEEKAKERLRNRCEGTEISPGATMRNLTRMALRPKGFDI